MPFCSSYLRLVAIFKLSLKIHKQLTTIYDRSQADLLQMSNSYRLVQLRNNSQFKCCNVQLGSWFNAQLNSFSGRRSKLESDHRLNFDVKLKMGSSSWLSCPVLIYRSSLVLQIWLSFSLL